MLPLCDQWNVEQEVSPGFLDTKTYDMSIYIFLIVALSPFIVMCMYIIIIIMIIIMYNKHV